MNYSQLLRFIRLALFLGGCSVFAILAAVFLHELGHALAVYLNTGQVPVIHFHPLVGAKTVYTVARGGGASLSDFWIAAGGILGGTVFSLVLFVAVRLRNVWTAPFVLIPVAATSGHGLMLISGALSLSTNDVSRMAALGAEPVLLAAAGVIMLYLSLAISVQIKPVLGLTQRDSLGTQSAVILGALAPYLLTVIIYNAVYQYHALDSYLMYIGFGVALILVGIALSIYLPFKNEKDAIVPVTVHWPQVLFSVMLAVLMTGIRL